MSRSRFHTFARISWSCCLVRPAFAAGLAQAPDAVVPSLRRPCAVASHSVSSAFTAPSSPPPLRRHRCCKLPGSNISSMLNTDFSLPFESQRDSPRARRRAARRRHRRRRTPGTADSGCARAPGRSAAPKRLRRRHPDSAGPASCPKLSSIGPSLALDLHPADVQTVARRLPVAQRRRGDRQIPA